MLVNGSGLRRAAAAVGFRPLSGTQQAGLATLRLMLLQGRTWRYLRYLHLRTSIAPIAHKISTMCICGAGRGLAEVAIALEFPWIDVLLTDIEDERHGYPNYKNALGWAKRLGVRNLRSGIWNVLEPSKHRFDLVASTEMLEHIEDDRTAAANMRRAAAKFVYCLVPFADAATNADPAIRKRVWERNEHYVCGYDAASLTALFPGRSVVSGAYWHDCGRLLRERLSELSEDDIAARQAELENLAKTDLREQRKGEPFGPGAIKILSRVSER